MAKITSLNGVAVGKIGAVVYATRNGQQIARKYQPVVSNPQTENQVKARARLKLCSQLGAVFGPYIAIPRRGVVSPRNLFVKKNYPSTSYDNNQADMDLGNIKLTDSAVFLPQIAVTKTSTTVTASVDNVADSLSRVVFVNCSITESNEIRVLGTEVVNTPDESGKFSFTFGSGGGYDALILAYGIRDNNDNARAAYGDVEALSATSLARLIVTRTLTEADITLTETRGLAFNTAQQ